MFVEFMVGQLTLQLPSCRLRCGPRPGLTHDAPAIIHHLSTSSLAMVEFPGHSSQSESVRLMQKPHPAQHGGYQDDRLNGVESVAHCLEHLVLLLMLHTFQGSTCALTACAQGMKQSTSRMPFQRQALEGTQHQQQNKLLKSHTSTGQHLSCHLSLMLTLLILCIDISLSP